MKLKIPQIFPQLLIHSCTLRHKSGDTGGYFPPTITEIDLGNVLIQGGSKITFSTDGNEMTCSKTLYYDCVNSTPRGIDFHEGDEIVFGDEVCTIKVVLPCYTDINNSQPHHVECGLC